MTDKNQKTEQAQDNSTNKPYGRASLPVEIGKGKTQWHTVGPVWNKRDGDGFIVEVEVLPVQYLTGNFDGPLRLVITPAKDEA